MDHRSFQKFIQRRIGFLVWCFVMVGMLLLAIFKDKGWLDVRAQAKRLTAIESQIHDLEAENQRLTNEIQALRTDPAAIEKIAREQLKLVKPGEVVLILPEEKPPDQK